MLIEKFTDFNGKMAAEESERLGNKKLPDFVNLAESSHIPIGFVEAFTGKISVLPEATCTPTIAQGISQELLGKMFANVEQAEYALLFCCAIDSVKRWSGYEQILQNWWKRSFQIKQTLMTAFKNGLHTNGAISDSEFYKQQSEMWVHQQALEDKIDEAAPLVAGLKREAIQVCGLVEFIKQGASESFDSHNHITLIDCYTIHQDIETFFQKPQNRQRFIRINPPSGTS